MSFVVEIYFTFCNNHTTKDFERERRMEVKDGALVFLALLSALLFGCLAFSVMHNANQIAELKAQQQKIEEEYAHLIKLANDATAVLQQSAANSPNTARMGEKNNPSYRLRRNAETPTINGTGSPTSAVSLLTQALSEIVNRQLNDYLDCDSLENESRCTIEPGPKGDRGEPGPSGQRGVKGDQGPVGVQGERGEKGQLGYPGYKGEMGQRGEVGPRGSVGPRGDTGARGPTARLTQNNCHWRYTDRCGYGCGTAVLKRTTCPTGQYVAGYGVRTNRSYGRYDMHILCCPVL